VIREINRGFRVPEISLANFDDIAAMRLRLEPEAFRISVENGDDAWEERIIIAAHSQTLRRRYRQPRLGTLCTPDRRLRLAHDAAFLRVLYDHFDRYRRSASMGNAVTAGLRRWRTRRWPPM
jgi:GntR family carbon starvation induced transcriptional regulator